jgi:hypothetical protein
MAIWSSMPRWIYIRPPERCHPTELVVARKLAVIMVDTHPFEQLGEVDQVGYWMAASRARQLLAVVHR